MARQLQQHIPWNKGLKGVQPSTRKGMKFPYKSHPGMKGKTPWNKGLTKADAPQMANSGVKKGNKSPWKGKTFSNEYRKKLSIAHGGIGNLEKTANRNARVLFQKTIRKAVLKRDNYTCQLCSERGGKLHVDHIQPWAEYIEMRFDMNNCRTLCVKCHYMITYKKPMPKTSTWQKYTGRRLNG